MNFFIYSRKSVYTGKGESIENQIEMCKQYISAKFPDDINKDITVYEDEGFSAKNTDRPQFKQMLSDIKLKKPNYVVCYRLDRISRNVSDFSSLIEELNDRSISFICIKEEFDTSKPMGKAMMYIASVFAQLERETIAERVRDNMLMLARTGRWLGGTTPTGYTSEKTQEIILDGKIKTSCQLKDIPEELLIVDMMFEKYLELKSVSGVSKYLIKNNIKSRSGKYYSLLGIKEILQNPVYCIADKDSMNYFIENNSDVCFEEKDCKNNYGLLSYNKRDYKKKHAPRLTKDKWIIAIGKHKGRIPGKQWVAVQNIIESNIPTGKKPAKMHNDYSLLSGMIYCHKCGNRMFAKNRTGRGANKETFDYICSNKLRGNVQLCDCQNINGLLADDLVCEYLMSYTNVNSEIYKILDKRKNKMKENSNNPITALEEKIKKLNTEMDNLINTLSANNLGEVFIQRINLRITELDKEINELSNKKKYLEKDLNILNNQELQYDIIINLLSSFKNNFKSLSIYDKRTLIKILVQKIVWDGQDLHIFIYGG